MITRSGLRVPRRSSRTKAGEQAGLSQCHSRLTTASGISCFSWQKPGLGFGEAGPYITVFANACTKALALRCRAVFR